VSFSRLRHDPPGSYSTVAGPSMFVLRSMRKHPEIFGGRFVNHSRTGAVSMITRRDEQSSNSQVPFAGLQPVPAAALVRSARPKDDSTLRSRTLLSTVSVAMPAHAVGPGRPAERRGRPASSIAAMYLCWPALCAGIRCLSTRPNVDASLADSKK